MHLILASQSPRRKELLGLFGVDFSVRAADIDETMDPEKPPFEEVARVSRAKARAIGCSADEVVVAADTIVVCDGQVLGKPRDEADAQRMLTMLSGRTHQVMTGLTVMTPEDTETCTEVAEITFRPLSQKEIRSYVRTGEPMDKAGAYGIQGGAALFAEKINGDFYNVMGLPVCRLGQILDRMVPEFAKERL